MEKYASRFQLVTGLEYGYYIVNFNRGKGWLGLYLKGFWNKFGTPLALSGTVEELREAICDVMGKEVYLPDWVEGQTYHLIKRDL